MSDKGRPHYGGRWICQKDATKCKGYFVAMDVGVYPCPLAEKCKGSAYPSGQLEHIWPRVRLTHRLRCGPPDWDKQHTRRRNEAYQAFCHEEYLDYHRARRVQNAEGINERVREVYYPALDKLAPEYVPPGKSKAALPPCGCDCRNCPYPEGPDVCRHEDWEEQHVPRHIKYPTSKEARGRKKQSRKERMDTDPVYAAQQREAHRIREAKRRRRIEWYRAGGDIDTFEDIWTQMGKDDRLFTAMWRECGRDPAALLTRWKSNRKG